MQTMHGSTGPNTLIITDILHDDILSMNIVSDKHEQASQSGWLGLHKGHDLDMGDMHIDHAKVGERLLNKA